jgi:hypothetical protein
VLGLFAIGLIWFGIANYRASVRLHVKIAELRAAGVPLSLAELKRTPPPPDDNAATYLEQAAAGTEAIEKIVTAAEDQLSQADMSRYAFQARTTPSMQASLQKAFTENSTTIPLLLKAASAPAYDDQLNYSLAPYEFIESYIDTMQNVRRPIRVLNYYVTMLLNEGRNAEAIDACIAMLQLCRHFDSRPLLVGYLVTLAVRGVAVHATNLALHGSPIPEDALTRLRAELQNQNPAAGLRYAIRTEHAYGAQAFMDLTAGNLYLQTPFGKNDLADHHGLLEGMQKRSNASYQEMATWLGSQRLGIFAQAMIPGMQASMAASTRLRTQLNCLQVLTALAGLPQSRDPKSVTIDDLKLPTAVTTDPYIGKPLQMRHEHRGWLVYAVGPNKVDDGGKIDDSEKGDYLDVGLGPPKGK